MKLEIVRGTHAYDFSDGAEWGLIEHDGFGMAPITNITQRSPYQDGASFAGFRVEPRLVQLAIYGQGTTYAELSTKAQTLMKAFKPTTNPLTLRVTYSGGAGDEVRLLDCRFDGDLKLGSRNHEGFSQTVGISLLATDPTWRGSTSAMVTFSTSLNQAISYVGTWQSFPIITITGPAADTVVTNTTTGDKLDFTASTIAAGRVVIIDCRQGHKSVKYSTGTAAIAGLTADSDLGTFCLAADPEAAGGTNNIAVTASGTSAATKVEVRYFTRYIGI